MRKRVIFNASALIRFANCTVLPSTLLRGFDVSVGTGGTGATAEVGAGAGAGAGVAAGRGGDCTTPESVPGMRAPLPNACS